MALVQGRRHNCLSEWFAGRVCYRVNTEDICNHAVVIVVNIDVVNMLLVKSLVLDMVIQASVKECI